MPVIDLNYSSQKAKSQLFLYKSSNAFTTIISFVSPVPLHLGNTLNMEIVTSNYLKVPIGLLIILGALFYYFPSFVYNFNQPQVQCIIVK